MLYWKFYAVWFLSFGLAAAALISLLAAPH
jgi:hypothetical protein